MSRNITPDEGHELLDRGRALHELSYTRKVKEIELDGMKIDLVLSKQKVICEVKSGRGSISAGRMQLLYYLYRLHEVGVDMVGEVRVPKVKETFQVKLGLPEERELLATLSLVKSITDLDKPPATVWVKSCHRCAYNGLCWGVPG